MTTPTRTPGSLTNSCTAKCATGQGFCSLRMVKWRHEIPRASALHATICAVERGCVVAPRRVGLGPVGETVRANIRRHRAVQGMTLRDLAARLTEAGHPMAHGTVSEVERGARRIDVDDLAAFATALGVSANDLLSERVEVVTRSEVEQLVRAILREEGVRA